MKKYIIYLGVLFSFYGISAQAAVWQSDAGKKWDAHWEQRYSDWVARSVGPLFFKNLGGVYAKLRIDCADAHYALIAYFARENGLPFAAGGGRLTHNTSDFDHIRNRHQRFAAFVKRIAANYGTESLSHDDSFPVNIYKIQPGDLFMYKVNNNGKYIRHTYIVKNINIDGTFDVMYSTQARFRKGLPLKRESSYEFTKAPLNRGVDRYYWGFRRAKPAHLIHQSQSSLPAESFNQYQLAESLGKRAFFRRLRGIYQNIEESPEMMMKRNFNAVCSKVQDRIEVVQMGVDFANKIGRCMDYQEYDTHSTPSRDSGLKDKYYNYGHDYQLVKEQGKEGRLTSTTKEKTRLTLSSQTLNSQERQKLFSHCPVTTSQFSTEIGSFRQSLFAGRVSFHPNDNLYRRWGFDKGSKTRCQAFYGYPD